MTDRQALLAAIRSHPDEDTPRLAFADWLDERGDTFFTQWAALIRAQIEAANTERYTRRWLELVDVQSQLFAARTREWDIAWGSRLGPTTFRRGFREAVHLAGSSFAKNAGTVFASSPIRALAISDLADKRGRMCQGIADHPGLAFIETLDIGGNTAEMATEFLNQATEGMPRLRALGLGNAVWKPMDEDAPTLYLSASHAADILSLPGLSHITALDLHLNPLFPNPLFRSSSQVRPESLFESPAMARMQWLDLAETRMTIAAVTALAHSSRLRNLRMLNLARHGEVNYGSATSGGFGPEGAAALAEGLAIRGVEYLDLSCQRIGDEGVRSLTASPVLSSVRELLLFGCEISDAGAIALAECPHLANCRRIELGGNAITDVGVRAFLTSPHMQKLVVLSGVRLDAEASLRFPPEWPALDMPRHPNHSVLLSPCP